MGRTRWPLILVVEDDDGAARALRDLLSDERYRVVVADDGDEALTECAIEEPDLILLDLKLQRMDGDEFLHRYRRRVGARAKVVVVSGRIGRDMPQLAVDDFVGKPFDPEDLLTRIRGLLSDGAATISG